jgi:hypothetical protein
MGFFDALFPQDATASAAALQTAGINRGIGQALPQWQQGINAATTDYGAAAAPWLNIYNTGAQGTTAYGNALGVNGPQGSAQAQQAFLNNPGYQFQLQQGDNAITAQNAASGKTGSGSEAIDLSKFNQGLAGTSWQNYVAALAPFLNMQTAGAQGYGTTQMNLANQLAAQYGNIGNAFYGADTSIGNAQAQVPLSGIAGSGNLLNLGSNLLGGILKAGTTAGYGSSLFGQLGSSLSDERLKENIEPVGALADGQTVYRYRYIGDPVTHIGLLAQETDPAAVVELLPDVLGVDYHRATDRASALMRIANDDELMRRAA